MSFSIKLNERNVDEERLLDDLHNVAKQLGKNTVSRIEYNELGNFSSTTFLRRFGSWFNALEKAGLEKSRTPMNLSDDELLNNIKNVWQQLGRQPKYGEMKSPLSLYSVSTYDKRFGGWNRSLVLFSEWIQSDDSDNDGSIIGDQSKNIEQIEQGAIEHKTKREISDRLRFRILMRDGFTCKSCGASPTKTLGVELHVDHIVPWSLGGETEEGNLQAKCAQCNLGKGNAFSV